MPLHGMFSRIMNWIGSHERTTVAAFLVVTGSLWGFIALADEVVEGESLPFDTRLLLALRTAADPTDPIGPPWVEELARDVTALGSVVVLSLMAVAVVGFLLLKGSRARALFVTLSLGGGMLVSVLLKGIFDRDRPDLVPHRTEVYTSSFPSGHSMMSALVFLTLGVLLATIQPNGRLRAYLLVVAVFLTGIVGVSRVYLGVHWPTDVLGGWSAGAAWALACWMVLRFLERRGDMPEGEGSPRPDS